MTQKLVSCRFSEQRYFKRVYCFLGHPVEGGDLNFSILRQSHPIEPENVLQVARSEILHKFSVVGFEFRQGHARM